MQTATKMDRLNLVLDVDQTLIHSLYCCERPLGIGWHSLSLIDKHSGGKIYWFQARPGVVTFLQTVRRLFEVSIYSLGKRDYVQGVLNVIAPWILPQHVWTRSDQNGQLNKMLSRVGLKSTNSLIVDDCPEVWCAADSGSIISIKPYLHKNHSSDRWLLRVLLPQLLTVLHENNDLHTRSLEEYLGIARKQTFSASNIVFVMDEFCYNHFIPEYINHSDSYTPLDQLVALMREAIRHGARCFLSAPRFPIREFQESPSYDLNFIESISHSMNLQTLITINREIEQEVNNLDSDSSLNSCSTMPGDFEWEDMTHVVFDPCQTFEISWKAIGLYRAHELEIASHEWLQDSCGAWTKFDTDPYQELLRSRSNVILRSI